MNNIQECIEATKTALSETSFRFFDEFSYGIDYRKNNYFLLDETGSLFLKQIICDGKLDIQQISKSYNVHESIIEKDSIAFMQQLQQQSHYGHELNLGNEQEEQFLKFFTEKKIPITAIIEITEGCNEDCVHCYRPVPKKEVWTPELFEKICIQLRELGTLQLDFTGGEPFLKKNFPTYLDIADKHGFIISILTNGTLIQDDSIDFLSKIKTRMIYFSLYSNDAGIHDSITKLPGSFDKTISTINKLISKGVPASINSPIMEHNKDSVKGIKRLADDLRIDVKFAYKISKSYNPKRQFKGINVFSDEEFKKHIHDKEVSLYSEMINARKQGEIIQRNRIRTCDTGFRSITISPEGDVIPCTALRLKCGNVLENNLDYLWQSNPNLKLWREEGSLVKKQCKTCESYDYCEPCPAGYFTEHNSLDGIDEVTCGFGKTFSSCVSCD